jgi:pyruvate formate lyase activating enzyme
MQIYKIDRRRIGTDGKGITDLVAMVGCPLKCKYCINKELLSKEQAHKTYVL